MQGGGPHCAALGDQREQLIGPKALDPRPEAQVGVRRHLRLHADQAFDDVEGGKLLALKEELSCEEGTVQRPLGEDRRHASGCQTAWSWPKATRYGCRSSRRGSHSG